MSRTMTPPLSPPSDGGPLVGQLWNGARCKEAPLSHSPAKWLVKQGPQPQRDACFTYVKRGETHTRTICCQPDALMALQLARHALLLSTLSSADDNLIVMIHKQTYGFTATSTTAPMNHFSSRRRLQSRNLLHEQLMCTRQKFGDKTEEKKSGAGVRHEPCKRGRFACYLVSRVTITWLLCQSFKYFFTAGV